jgi:hypothetical protein
VIRTLVLGIPLPHAAFDNASFLSAPSFSEYRRMVFEPSSAARVVQEVVEGTHIHQTYGGQAIVNGQGSAHAFGLAELLDMRRREGHRLVAGGGLVVVFGHPEITVSGVGGGGEWRSYSWLPSPEGLAYAEALVPGFGTPGAVLTDSEHPFAPLVHAVAHRVAYRVHLDEDAPGAGEAARVFCRSSGGVAIGFELTVGSGSLVVLPVIQKPDTDRQAIAAALVESLERWEGRLVKPAVEA